jgi:DNA-binding response OmpR family regulator
MNYSILIVEDEARLSQLLKMYLERESFMVDVVDNGIDGLKKATQENHDLILLDVLMPGINGFMVLEELRKIKDTPVIMLSAQSDEKDQKLALELGANEYILNPFSPSDVVVKIKNLLVNI